MIFSVRSFLLIFLCLVADNTFAQHVKSIIDKAPNQEAFWSVTVLDEEGNELESVYPDKLIIPASNQKLYTLGAVLDRLGSSYKYTTNLYGDGNLIDSTWSGTFVFKGTGDPSISDFLYEGNAYHVFRSFAEQLKEKGIYNLSGSLIADVSYFDEDTYPKGWSWDDLSFYYGVEISPLSFNNNAVDLVVFADGQVGERPSITWFPENTSFVNMINHQEITPADSKYDEYYRRYMGSNRIVLASKVPRGYVEKESLSVFNSAMFFIQSFRTFLNSNGFEAPGSYMIQSPSPGIDGMRVLAKHDSKPLSELVIWANKESDNFYTEMLLKTLAAETRGIPGTFENGIEEVRVFLAGQNVDTNLVKMNDGSGLASGNFTTTGNISRFLHSMKRHKESDTFYESMPVAGIDGSIAHRFKGTPLYNNLRAKTGYVSGVRTLSGYLVAKSGKEITFSIATNHFAGKVGVVDRSHQQILEFLYAKY